MSQLDIFTLCAIIIVMLAFGVSGRGKTSSAEDYFLAGRDLRWWQIGFSLFASNFSASAIIGLTGAAYITGIAIYNYEWVGILAMIFFAVVLAASVRRSQVFTIAEYLDQRYNPQIKLAYSVFIIFLIIFIDMAASLYAGGLLLREIFPHLTLNVIIFAVMFLAGTYSVLGGLKAISRTDILQSFILITGALMITYFTFKAAGGWNQIVSDAPPGSLTLIRGPNDRAVPWSGLVMGIPVLCAYFWLTNQNMVQWVLSAKSENDARRGLLMAGYMKLIVLFIIILPGVAAVKLFPGLSEPDSIYPTLLFELLPSGFLGVVVAGFVAALMSNTDSTLHAASTIITMDFVKKARPLLSPEGLVWSGRVTTIIIIFLSAVWAPMIGRFGTLFEYVQGLLSYAVAPFVVVYLAGWFWPRANGAGALAALGCGLSAAIITGLMQHMRIIDIHYLHVPLPVALVSLLALVCVSRLSAPSNIRPELLVGGGQRLRRSDQALTALLLMLIALQLYIFW